MVPLPRRSLALSVRSFVFLQRRQAAHVFRFADTTLKESVAGFAKQLVGLPIAI